MLHIFGILAMVGILLLFLGTEFGYVTLVSRVGLQLRTVARTLSTGNLQRSSALLIGSQAINAIGAFIFWVLCARLFPAHQVGLATALISYGALVATFTQLGLPVTVLRFLPTSRKRSQLLSAAISIVSLASVLGGLVAIAAIHTLVPKLGFVHSSIMLSLMLVAIVVGTSVGSLTDGVMASLRSSEFVFRKAVVTNVPRVLLVFMVGSLGSKGMVGIYSAMLLLGITYSLSVIARKWLDKGALRPSFQELLSYRGFAAANYFGSMFGVLPGTLTPLIVLDKLGASQAAFFYMPMQLAVFLGVIASSTCQALLAETAQTNDETQYAQHVIHATKHLYQLLIPAAALLGIGGWAILRIYGASYASHGFLPLGILCLASLPVGVNWIGDTWLNIKRQSLAYFFMNACNALTVVGGVFLLAGHGLIGVALGWLIGQTLSAAIYVVLFARDRLSSLRRPAPENLFEYAL
jgi:O-antigen/teichoic acid export membrane protein